MQIPNLGILAIEICYKLLQHLQIFTTFHVLPLAGYAQNENRVVLVYDHFDGDNSCLKCLFKFKRKDMIFEFIDAGDWSEVLHWVFCPGSILPVHPDAVENDGEADVEDEVDEAKNQGNNSLSFPN